MTPQEFIYNAKKVIYEQVAVNTNLVITGNKTSSAISTFFTNIPMQVALRRIPATPKKKKKLWSLSRNCSVHLKHDDGLKIYVTFFYTKDADLKKLYDATCKHGVYFGYTYIREMLRLTMNHNTKAFYNQMSTYLASTTAPKDHYYSLIMAASDYHINQIINTLYSTPSLQRDIAQVLKYQRYNEFDNSNMINTLQRLTNEYYDIAPWSEEDFAIVEFNGSECIQQTDFGLVNDTFQEEIIDLGESLKQAMGEASRDTATASIFTNVFAEAPIKQGQLKKFKKSLKRKVYEMTNDFSCNWGGLNTVYRHKFKSPKKEFYDSRVNIILSIDQSGSMDTDILGKLTSLIKELGKKIAKITVLIHDTEVTKTFILESNSADISTAQGFKEALKTRYKSGGTSHYNVFKAIAEMSKEDLEKCVYISYSDNYSDIPQAWDKFSVMKSINTYLISPINNPVKGLPTHKSVTNIYLI